MSQSNSFSINFLKNILFEKIRTFLLRKPVSKRIIHASSKGIASVHSTEGLLNGSEVVKAHKVVSAHMPRVDWAVRVAEFA